MIRSGLSEEDILRASPEVVDTMFDLLEDGG